MNQDPPKVFISYKWEDKAHNEWVKNFARDLRASGIDAKLDVWEVSFGDSFTDYMTSKIKEADAVLFIITTRSVAAVEAPKGKGGPVKFEMQMANSRRMAGEEMRLIGIFREGNATSAHLRDHRYADFRNDAEYEMRLNELVDDLLGKDQRPPLLQRKEPSSTTISPTDSNVMAREIQHIVEGIAYGEVVYFLGADSKATPLHDFLAATPAVLRNKNYAAPYQLIVTTNYDDTLERVFRKLNEPFDLITYVVRAGDEIRGGRFWHFPHEGNSEPIMDPNTYTRLAIGHGLELGRTVILKILGGVNPREATANRFPITEDDFFHQVTQKEFIDGLPITLKAKLFNSSLVFIGYNLEERTMRDMLRWVLRNGMQRFRSWSIQPGMQINDSGFWERKDVISLNVDVDRFIRELSDQINRLPRITT